MFLETSSLGGAYNYIFTNISKLISFDSVYFDIFRMIFFPKIKKKYNNPVYSHIVKICIVYNPLNGFKILFKILFSMHLITRTVVHVYHSVCNYSLCFFSVLPSFDWLHVRQIHDGGHEIPLERRSSDFPQRLWRRISIASLRRVLRHR